ncbi:MAG: PorV/PorQ family protein [bacterium]
MVFPDARSTALGGCGAASRDLAANTYYNPAALAWSARAGAAWTHVNWLPGLYGGMTYDYIGAALRPLSRLGAGLNVTYLSTGSTDVVNERGESLGSYTTFDVAPQASAGYRLSRSLALGIGVKGIYSFLMPEWVWESMPGYFDFGGTAFTVAADIGAQYRPASNLGLGLAVHNLGPGVRYTRSGDDPADPLPAIARFGLDYVPGSLGRFEFRLVADVWRDLVTDFRVAGTGFERVVSFTEQFQFGAGVEVTFARVASLRLGYFQDIYGQRGGLVCEKSGTGQSRHISPLRYLTEGGWDKPMAWGLCWGCGVEFGGFAFDVGVDEDIYDFLTPNVRAQVSWQLR